MIKNLIPGINLKRATATIFVVFAYIWLSDFLIHGLIMANAYQETAELWRSPLGMQDHMVWMFLGQFIIAKFFTLVFIRGYEGKGILEGVRFATLIGPLIVGPYLIQYAVSPLPGSIIGSWIGFGLLQVYGAGILAAAVYRK